MENPPINLELEHFKELLLKSMHAQEAVIIFIKANPQVMEDPKFMKAFSSFYDTNTINTEEIKGLYDNCVKEPILNNSNPHKK